MWTYPADTTDDLADMASLLGSYWPATYGGADLVLDFVRACMLAEKQVVASLGELEDGISRLSQPISHVSRWQRISLRKSQETIAHPILFGGGEEFGPQPADGKVYTFGAGRDQAVAYPLPTNLVSGLLLADALTAPGILLVEGVGFHIDTAAGVLIFPSSPFLDARLTSQPPADDPTDLELDLWLFGAGWDHDLVYQKVGYQIGVQTPSTPASLTFINALLDCVVSGTTLRGVQQVLAAMTGAPLARQAGIVQAVVTDTDNLTIITDGDVYRYSSLAVPLVAVGDRIKAGDVLTDVVRVYDPRNGKVPFGLASLSLGPEFFTPVLSGPLVFSNTAVPLSLTTVSGRTRVSWSLGGATADVTAFFDALHANGIAAGKTLAQFLDTRLEPTGEPAAGDLPATVNPLAMLFANCLRYNTLVAVLRQAAFAEGAPGMAYLWTLRKVVPPHMVLITVAV